MKTPCFALVVMLGLCGCGSPKPDNSFEAAVRRVSEQPCQRGGPLYIDISSSDAKQWRVKSVNHPGEEVSLDAINWGVTNGEVYEGLAHARNYAGKDTLESVLSHKRRVRMGLNRALSYDWFSHKANDGKEIQTHGAQWYRTRSVPQAGVET